jgi:hypothetical protein
MDSLENILAGRQSQEPPESKAIKLYVRDIFQTKVEVRVREREIIVNVPSAALANTLRLRFRDLQKAAGTDKRLVFRIG